MHAVPDYRVGVTQPIPPVEFDLRVGSERQRSLLELNDALRDAIVATRLSEGPPAGLDEATDLIRRAAELIAPHQHPGPHQQAGFDHPGPSAFHTPSDLAPDEFFPFSPIIGWLNPVAAPVRMWREADPDPSHPADAGLRIAGAMTLPAPYAGPPSTVHGGVVAMVFDELLGVCAVANGVGAMTGTLTVRYRRPTPLDHEVTLRSWVDRIEGRKVFIDGTMHHEGELTAEAEGIFIRVSDTPSTKGS